jgi:hypothetical protein
MTALAKHLTTSPSLHARFASALVALVIAGYAAPSAAATAEERQACTPDVFRLCSSEIPNVPKITACMKQNRSKLSPACAAVFKS